MMLHVFFQLNTTWKGKLIDQIESNSQIQSIFSEYIYTFIIVHYIWFDSYKYYIRYHKGLKGMFVLNFFNGQDI